MKKFLAMLIPVTIFLSGCTAPKTNIFEGNGFSFNYPIEYTADAEGLWTEEGYEFHINPPEGCSLCQVPYLEVKAEETNSNLEEFISAYHTLSETSYAEMHEEMSIGEYEFTKVTVADMLTVTGYYTKHNNTVLAFRVYQEDYNANEIEEMIESLTFN